MIIDNPDSTQDRQLIMLLVWIGTKLIALLSIVSADGYMTSMLKLVSIISFSLLIIINIPGAYRTLHAGYLDLKKYFTKTKHDD